MTPIGVSEGAKAGAAKLSLPRQRLMARAWLAQGVLGESGGGISQKPGCCCGVVPASGMAALPLPTGPHGAPPCLHTGRLDSQ